MTVAPSRKKPSTSDRSSTLTSRCRRFLAVLGSGTSWNQIRGRVGSASTMNTDGSSSGSVIPASARSRRSSSSHTGGSQRNTDAQKRPRSRHRMVCRLRSSTGGGGSVGVFDWACMPRPPRRLGPTLSPQTAAASSLSKIARWCCPTAACMTLDGSICAFSQTSIYRPPSPRARPLCGCTTSSGVERPSDTAGRSRPRHVTHEGHCPQKGVDRPVHLAG